MKKQFMDTDQIRLTEIHRKAAAAYQDGGRDAGSLVPEDDLGFLAACGISAQTLLDYAEDFVRYGEPDTATFVRVVEIRRDHLRSSPNPLQIAQPVPESELPRKMDEWEGIAWLPRITQKARCFLDGTLAPEIMYGCGGDRAFIQKLHLTLPGFLELVRQAGNDDKQVIKGVQGM